MICHTCVFCDKPTVHMWLDGDYVYYFRCSDHLPRNYDHLKNTSGLEYISYADYMARKLQEVL